MYGFNSNCMKKETLQIKEVSQLTPEAVQLSFEIPEASQKQYGYVAGQYITLETIISGETVRRSYSICSAPYEDDLAVGIKAIPKGVFSNHAQKLKAGDSLVVGFPEGRFVYRETHMHQLGIAAGSGITPIMSLLKTHLAQSSQHRFTLIYGNKSPETAMFYEELGALEQQMEGRLTIHWVFSRASEKDAAFGRIDAGYLKHVLKGFDSQPSYLCGPEAMIQTSQQVLESLGFSKEEILYELFYSENTEKKTDAEAGTAQLELICDGETHQLQLSGESILDAALKHKIDVPYSCQGGVCSSCIAKVTEGKARMENNQILTDGEVAEGLVLTCQAYAESSKIVVDYDDV